MLGRRACRTIRSRNQSRGPSLRCPPSTVPTEKPAVRGSDVRRLLAVVGGPAVTRHSRSGARRRLASQSFGEHVPHLSPPRHRALGRSASNSALAAILVNDHSAQRVTDLARPSPANRVVKMGAAFSTGCAGAPLEQEALPHGFFDRCSRSRALRPTRHRCEPGPADEAMIVGSECSVAATHRQQIQRTLLP